MPTLLSSVLRSATSSVSRKRINSLLLSSSFFSSYSSDYTSCFCLQGQHAGIRYSRFWHEAPRRLRKTSLPCGISSRADFIVPSNIPKLLGFDQQQTRAYFSSTVSVLPLPTLRIRPRILLCSFFHCSSNGIQGNIIPVYVNH